MTSSPQATITSLGVDIRRGDITSVGLTDECLKTIAARNSTLNAFITVCEHGARKSAKALDEELAKGKDRGPLHGIPISLKDVIDLQGIPTTGATRHLAQNKARRDAVVVSRLRTAGAVLIGKCNLHELAFGTTGEESASGPTRNPHSMEHIAGGSSSGSAISVATGMSLASLGTDTGGSIRIPASACGVIGLKPTHGEISMAGVLPLAPSLDHVGLIARSVQDVTTVFQIIRDVQQSHASTSWDKHFNTNVDVRPLRSGALVLGIPRSYFFEKIDPAVHTAFEKTVIRLNSVGYRVRDATIPQAKYTGSVYLHTQLSEASECYSELLDNQPETLSEEIRLRLELGRYVLAEDYVRAQRARKILRDEVDAELLRYSALLLPTLAIIPPRLGTKTITFGGESSTTRALTLRLTQLFNLTGHPVITIPCGTAEGLPIGVQLVGRRGRTEQLLSLASICEEAIRG